VDPSRKIALITGVFFVVTFVSIPALILYGPLLNDPNYVTGPGADQAMYLGAFLEFVTGIANVGTAVTLYPLVRRQNETLAISYVASRAVESAFIVTGIFAVLSVVTLRQDFAATAGADAATYITIARTMVAFHDWTFTFGPGLLAGFGNGLILGTLMYQSGLVPRAFALVGVIGGPLVFSSGIAALFGLWDQVSVISFVLTVPEIIWEAGLGIWLIVRGFSPPAAAALMARP
jgi:hypothetical protein